MTYVPQNLSVGAAMANFSKLMDAIHGPSRYAPARASAPPVFAEAEAERFRIAENILAAACPAPARCDQHRCRRNRVCQHFERLRAIQCPPQPQPFSRRSPGAQAVRYAVWVYMNINFA